MCIQTYRLIHSYFHVWTETWDNFPFISVSLKVRFLLSSFVVLDASALNYTWLKCLLTDVQGFITATLQSIVLSESLRFVLILIQFWKYISSRNIFFLWKSSLFYEILIVYTLIYLEQFLQCLFKVKFKEVITNTLDGLETCTYGSC